MPIKNPEKKSQNRHSEIRCPPYNASKNQKKKIWPSEKRLWGVPPPYNTYKNTRKNKLNEINKDSKKKSKIEPKKYVYQGFPL